MELIAKKIAKTISESINYDFEQEEIIAYGLIAIIQIFFSMFFVIVLSLLFHVLPEALILLFSVSILRKYSGGTHANSIELCTITSVLYSVGFALISKLFALYLNNYQLILFSIIIFIFSYYIIYKYAPVDSPNKQIKTPKKINRMRKGSFIVLTFYLIISILFISLSQIYKIWTSLLISLIFGMIWQITSLTKFGALIAVKFNNFIKK